MRFSLNWLKKHLDTNLSIYELANKMTAIGLEVESVAAPEKIFEKFQLAEIEKVEDHPNADRLHLCTVRNKDGKTRRIVCGAYNVRVGLKTVLALEGAYIPGKNFVLKKNKIRGIVSEGMMCSREELCMPPKEPDGIIDLGDHISLDDNIGDVLGYDGGIFDVSITPNRGDCFSVKGIARDLAAAGAGIFIEHEISDCHTKFDFPLNIVCDYNNEVANYAPMMSFRVIRNIHNQESPEWLKRALQIAGINSISLIVDLANWYMIDSGRPLHIYDLDKIEGNFHIKFAKHLEDFVDLKKNAYELRTDMLIAADDNDPLCVLGIIGGDKIACSLDTKNILIESALFDQICISKTGNTIDLMSDARMRNERGIDKASCNVGLEAISNLILENCGGEASSIKSYGAVPNLSFTVELRSSYLNDLCGCKMNWNDAIQVLQNLGFKLVKSNSEKADFIVPSWRSDISIEEDLVEEILRIYGYEHIAENAMPLCTVADNEPWKKIKRQNRIRRILAASGLSEIISYEFVKDVYAKAFQEDHSLIYLLNPISSELNTMRPSLLPSLINAATNTLKFCNNSVALFEVGHVFYNDCKQCDHISGIRIGDYNERNWLNKQRQSDVFDVKKDAMQVLSFCGINSYDVSCNINNLPSYYHPYRSAALMKGRYILGYFGELHPKINELFGISQKIQCFELFYESFANTKTTKPMYNDKVFPKICRDFAFSFDKDVAIGDVINEISKIDKIITCVSMFDHFDLGQGQKSIGISVILGADDRTLTEQEAQIISDKIVNFVSTRGGVLRTR